MNLKHYYLTSKETYKTSFTTFKNRVDGWESPDTAIKKRKRRHQWKTLKEIVETTWKGKAAVYNYIQRHPDCSIEDIKNANKINNNRKHYINGVPLKEYIKKHWLSYSWFLHFIRKWMSLDEIVLHYKKKNEKKAL